MTWLAWVALFSPSWADDGGADVDSSDDAKAPLKPWDRVGWGFGGVPALNFNSDEGFGFGAVASLYRYNGKLQPYKTAVTLQLFGTTLGVQAHWLRVDMLRVADTPLRLTVRGGINTTAVDNYCGIGSEVTCDPARAVAAANAAGLVDDPAVADDPHDTFVRRYYRTRYIYPNFRIEARYALDPMPHRFELLAGYRGNFITMGTFREPGPWPGSLYEEDFGDVGERGYTGVFQLGAMLDNRDNEPAPTRGYWVEATVRAAPRFLGSDFEYVGFNTTLRGYAPLFTERVVLAQRVLVDAISGEAPIRELAIPGGTQRYDTYGSLNAGRGIRQRRFIGKTRAMSQTELRVLVIPFRVFRIPVDLHLLGFADVGFVGAEFSDFGAMFATPLPSGGGGVRLAIDKNFVLRADLGFSPFESGPGVYIDIDNTF